MRLATIDATGVERHYLPGDRLPFMPEKDVTGGECAEHKGMRCVNARIEAHFSLFLVFLVHREASRRKGPNYHGGRG